jgi:hypothetical protein
VRKPVAGRKGLRGRLSGTLTTWNTAVANDYAARLALIAFATAAIQGLFTRAAFEPALKTALAATAAFYVLGWLCGEMARRLVEEGVQRNDKSQPVLAPGTAPIPPQNSQSPGR